MVFTRTLGIAIPGLVLAFVLMAPFAAAQVVPDPINHQGYIEVDGQPFNGNGAFRFAIVTGGGNNLWTHDGSELGTASMPGSPLALSVDDGVYSVALGDGTTTDPFAGGLFADNEDLALRVWFDDGTNGVQQLTPDQPLSSTPYARVAATTQSVPDEITVSRVNYSSPRTHTLPIPPTAFRGQTETDSYVVGAGSLYGSGDTTVVAPVVLPQGAVMTKLSAWLEDNDPDSYLVVDLRRADIDSTGAFTAASVNGDGLSGTGVREATSISGPTVDNTAYKYGIRVYDTNGTWEVNDSRLLHVAIEYEISEVK